MGAFPFRVVAFVISCLLGSVASGQSAAEQSVDRVYVTNIESARDLQEIVRLIRLMTKISEASADTERRAVTLRGTAAQLALAEWLMGELDVSAGQPSLAQHSQEPASHEVLVADSDDLLRVFRLKHAATDTDLQEISTLFATITDIQSVFTNSAARALVARAAPGKIRAAEWLVDALDKPADWQPPKAPDGPSFPYGSWVPGAPDTIARVFYLTNTPTSSAMQELGVTLRAIASVRWVFLFDSLKALVLRGRPEDVALAEWLVTELDAPASRPPLGQQSQSPAPHERWAPDPHGDDLVLVYHLEYSTTDRDLREIFSLIRANARIACLSVDTAPNAVVARATAAKIALAEQLVKEWDKPHSLGDAR